MADIELEGQINLKVTRAQARKATKDAAEEAGKQIAEKTEGGFAKGLEKAAGERLRGVVGRFGSLGRMLAQVRLPGAAGAPGAAAPAAAEAARGIPTLSSLVKVQKQAVVAGGTLTSRLVALATKAGLVVGAALLVVGAAVAAAKALKRVVTGLLAFGRSLARSSAAVAFSFARLDVRMEILRLKIGNKLSPQIDRLTNSVARLVEQVGSRLVPIFQLLFFAASALVDVVAAVAPGGRGRTPVQDVLLAGTGLTGILITALIALADSLKGNTQAIKDRDLKIPAEEAGRLPALLDLIIGGAPQRAPAPAGRAPGADLPDAARRRFVGPANAADVAIDGINRTLDRLRASQRGPVEIRRGLA